MMRLHKLPCRPGPATTSCGRANDAVGPTGSSGRLSHATSDQGKNALAGSFEPEALNLLDLRSFRDRIASRDPDRQTADVHIRVAPMNRFDALGTAEIKSVISRVP